MYAAHTIAVDRLVCTAQQCRLFKPLSFTLTNGQILALHGANGVGKTTCLRTLAGLLTPARGKIYWQQRLLQPYDAEYLAQMVYIGHHAGIKLALTPTENISQSLVLAGHKVTSADIYQALTRVDLGHCANAACSHLSAGQQRRVNLARLFLMSHWLAVPVWILDEPLTALDRQGMHLVQELLVEHKTQGGSVILTSHQQVAMATSVVELEP